MTSIINNSTFVLTNPLGTQVGPTQYVDKNPAAEKPFLQTSIHYLAATDKKQISNDPAYESLDALLEEEAQKRLGLEQWNGMEPSKKTSIKKDMACSSINRPDMEATLKVGEKEHTVFQTFSHNSSLNGKKYTDQNGKTVEITHAIAASQDRHSPNTKMLRKISDSQGTICYTGRPETEDNALEQASWLFESALASDKKGIALQKGIYTFTYVVDSLLSVGRVGILKEEQKQVEEEVAALKALEKKGVQTVNGRQVIFKPILISHVFNLSHEAEEALPSLITNAGAHDELAQKGLDQLRALALNKPNVRQAISALADFSSLLPEEKILHLYLLSEALNLPLVLHCISSKDRTGVAIAIVSALRQWRADGHVIDEAALKNPEFKEYFAANLMIAHQVARFGRGAAGAVVNGETLEDLLGLELGGTIPQSPIALRLLPARYLEEINALTQMAWGTLFYTLAFTVWIPTIIVAFVIDLLASPFYSLYKGEPTWFLHTAPEFLNDLMRLFCAYKLVPTSRISAAVNEGFSLFKSKVPRREAEAPSAPAPERERKAEHSYALEPFVSLIKDIKTKEDYIAFINTLKKQGTWTIKLPGNFFEANQFESEKLLLEQVDKDLPRGFLVMVGKERSLTAKQLLEKLTKTYGRIKALRLLAACQQGALTPAPKFNIESLGIFTFQFGETQGEDLLVASFEDGINPNQFSKEYSPYQVCEGQKRFPFPYEVEIKDNTYTISASAIPWIGIERTESFNTEFRYTITVDIATGEATLSLTATEYDPKTAKEQEPLIATLLIPIQMINNDSLEKIALSLTTPQELSTEEVFAKKHLEINGGALLKLIIKDPSLVIGKRRELLLDLVIGKELLLELAAELRKY